MTLSDAYPIFIEHGRAERQYAQETLVKLKDCFRSWILPVLGGLALNDVSRMDILSLRTKMTDSNLGTNRQYSILMTLKLFFKFCRQVLKIDCLDPNQEIQLPQRPKPHVTYLADEEVERVRNAIPLHTFTGLRMRVLAEVLLTTGLRISEALSLDRTPFEMAQSEIEMGAATLERRPSSHKFNRLGAFDLSSTIA